MKRFLIILCCFLFVAISIFLVKTSMIETTETKASICSGYALITKNNSYLYRYTLDNSSINSRYFLLEQSYYVKVIENSTEDFYKVLYKDVIGYVKKNDVKLVEEEPLTPYPDEITFDIYSGSSVELRTEPTTKNGIGSIVYTLPSNTKNINYIGKITGEESIKGLGNIWYFASFTLSNNKVLYGYIYSPLTLNLSPITQNTENLTEVSITNYVPLESLLYLNLNTKSLIILVIIIPTIFLLYLFVKPTKILKDK